MTTKICIILGTRPEIIKMSPIIRAAEQHNLDFFVLHTGQHYSYEMDKLFFQQLELPETRYNLDVGSTTQGEQTAKMLTGIEKILIKEKPNIVLVEGDTNTVFAGALAAAKLQIKVGHVEAGLRSYDRTMPEEINRVLTDHCSDYLFAPTEKARGILLSEDIPDDKIFVTGNTIVDAVMQNLKISNHTEILNKRGLKKREFFLLTAHRQENVDKQERLAGILKGLGLICENFNLPVVYPIHPRTKKMIERFNLDIPVGINLIDPVGFLEFLQLESGAKLVLTDSGGVQEETCVLGVPCLTLRDNTERPETIEVGANRLVGTNPTEILAGVEKSLEEGNGWNNPFGDGRASEKILSIIN